MTKEEIKEYLKRVDELELKLLDEDKDTLQWLIFGYNECARLLYETEQKNQFLKEENKDMKRTLELVSNSLYTAELTQLKDRINKAIEYIETHTRLSHFELEEMLKGDNNG